MLKIVNNKYLEFEDKALVSFGSDAWCVFTKGDIEVRFSVDYKGQMFADIDNRYDKYFESLEEVKEYIETENLKYMGIDLIN